MKKYMMTSNGVEEPMDATNLADAKIEARAWATCGSGVTIWQGDQPICKMDFEEGGLLGLGNGARTWSHGPWYML